MSAPVCKHYQLLIAVLLGLFATAPVASAEVPGVAEVASFDAAAALAESLSKTAYAPPDALPNNLKKLSYDDLRNIRFAPRESVWRMERLPFQLQFFHPGGLQKDRIDVQLVEGEVVNTVEFAEAMFEYKDVDIDGRVPETVGFSGFRVHYPLNRPDYLDELLVFQGASYFRALAKDAIYGLSARALGIRIAEGEKEEFSRFTHFWVEKPDRVATEIKIWGIFDSESAVGAAEFVIKPGATTVMDVRIRVFFRVDVEAPAFAPLTSMFWYGENTPYKFGDFRPEVHDSDGVLIHTGDGEWLWRPLVNETNRFRWSSFSDQSVRGFGLFQRDRAFGSYEDLEALYHLRPSAWVEPAGESWGPGEVRLVELPTNTEYGDNVNVYFVPGRPIKAGELMDFAYRMYWFLEDPDWPPQTLGRTVSTRVAEISYNLRARRFVLDFSRPSQGPDVEAGDIRIDLAVDRAKILGSFLQKNDHAGTWRTFFDVEATSTNLPAELRCTLYTEQGPLTETWVYQWMHSDL